MFIIVGLGNPGKEYECTRHNVGFLAVDALRTSLHGSEWKLKQKFLCDISTAEVHQRKILLVKPGTFMNRSGECVKKLVDFYQLDPSKQILVVVDDIDIPLGTHRLRSSGGPGTHNGMKSITEHIGEEFPRLRIGIGPKPESGDLAAWVLSRPSAAERDALETAFAEVTTVIEAIVEK